MPQLPSGRISQTRERDVIGDVHEDDDEDEGDDDVDEDEEEDAAGTARLCSSSRSCPMKLRFGEMMGRACFTCSYASAMDSPRKRMRYAMATAADLDTPA